MLKNWVVVGLRLNYNNMLYQYHIGWKQLNQPQEQTDLKKTIKEKLIGIGIVLFFVAMLFVTGTSDAEIIQALNK